MKTIAGVGLMAVVAFAPLGSARGEGDAGRDEAVRKLETLKVSVDFQDVKLTEAVDYLREVTGLNFVLMPKAAEKDPEAKVRLKVRDLTVRSVLKLLLHPRGLTATYREGALLIVPQDEIQDDLTLQLYDVRALEGKIQDFPGPKMELTSPGKGNAGPITTGIFILEEPRQPLPPDFILELVKENTGGKSWDSNPKTAISHASGMLVVNQSPAVHREIKSLLARLEQYR